MGDDEEEEPQLTFLSSAGLVSLFVTTLVVYGMRVLHYFEVHEFSDTQNTDCTSLFSSQINSDGNSTGNGALRTGCAASSHIDVLGKYAVADVFSPKLREFLMYDI